MLEFSPDPRVAEEQVRTILFYLVATSFIDEELHRDEDWYIRVFIREVIEHRARCVFRDPDAPDAREQVSRWIARFHKVLEGYERQIATLLAEDLAHGETAMQFVASRLKLRCLELLGQFDEAGQQEILAAVGMLITSDGVLHPREEAFRDELVALLDAPLTLELDDVQLAERREVVVEPVQPLAAPREDHPFFDGMEWDFARDREAFAEQARTDLELQARAIELLTARGAAGAGRLAAARSFADFAGGEPFLDGHVHVLPPRPGTAYDLLVLGDLHGCYSCLKSALLQADFFGRLEAHRAAPDRAPAPYIVFLGDYIDRGRFGFAGTLRTALRLLLAYPDNVILLRGNHEHYLEFNGQVVSPVRPCEALDRVADLAPPELLHGYRRLFDALPVMLDFGGVVFVHGGVPRDETLRKRWQGLASLNDESIRFEMMWGDPGDMDAVPDALQRQSTRFAFGRRQLAVFLHQLGCRLMVRGHELVDEGFRHVYDDPRAGLVTVFAAGGGDNRDLPEESHYRKVRPTALLLHHLDGVTRLRPFALDYARYNDPARNGFYRSRGPAQR